LDWQHPVKLALIFKFFFLFCLFADKVTCLQVLNLMVILGFMLNYALRVNLTIAIVAMVVPTPTNTSVANVTLANSTASAAALADVGGGGATIDEHVGTFQWDSYQQNFILGSFFWGYILTELPGGRLAELIGGHRVFGHSMLWASVLTLLTPAAAMLDYTALIILRVLLGFMLGEYTFDKVAAWALVALIFALVHSLLVDTQVIIVSPLYRFSIISVLSTALCQLKSTHS
jgi:hypothetical protein